MVLLDTTYASVAQWGVLIGPVSVVLIGLGEFARRAYPRLWPYPAAGEVVGWLSWVGLSVAETLTANDGAPTCSSPGGGCPTSLGGALWAVASPYTTDLAVAAAVTLLGWMAATVALWARRRPRAGSRSGARAA